MRTRKQTVSPKLRAVLFLIDGSQSFGQLLERAGSLSDLLESQIRELLDLGLIYVLNTDPSSSRDAIDESTAQVSPGYRAPAKDLPPLVAAKMQLLLRLENTNSDEVDLLGAELLDAKNLRDLAFTAKSVTARLTRTAGSDKSQQFWSDAKEILVAWRDLSAKAKSADGQFN